MKKLVILLALILGSFFALMAATKLYMQQKVEVDQEVQFEVNQGSSLTAVARQLYRRGIIHHPRVFVKIGQFKGYGNKIHYGEYLVHPTDRYEDIYAKILSGDTIKYPVTFIEGDHIYDYARRLQEAGLASASQFLKLVKNPIFVKEMLGQEFSSLEGYLFPETYHFSKTDKLKTIVKTLVDKFKQETQNLNFSRQPGMSRHQVVTLASIIEKETGAPFERPLISSVFHNRLKKKMRLQTDPTIIYGLLAETGNEISNITRKDLKKPTAYNTYVISGLPPGPIGNPGIESLRAALNPKPSPYLYFVSQNDGTHIFTETYQKHLKAVKKFQLDPRARQGKSWRDLKTKGTQ